MNALPQAKMTLEAYLKRENAQVEKHVFHRGERRRRHPSQVRTMLLPESYARYLDIGTIRALTIADAGDLAVRLERALGGWRARLPELVLRVSQQCASGLPPSR